MSCRIQCQEASTSSDLKAPRVIEGINIIDSYVVFMDIASDDKYIVKMDMTSSSCEKTIVKEKGIKGWHQFYLTIDSQGLLMYYIKEDEQGVYKSHYDF